ncbi:MAG: hypothetical protein H5U08_13720 [Thermogutta sp.]|uniref:hypothetical protein n=1 Tax=Thermogutta sp. TaxID=1962930 RepID=UPI00198A86B1|nr:hypothetical protein [Thermogutta sp.]MBC7353414.1 hypothetical protein [Thermogutta sp.]
MNKPLHTDDAPSQGTVRVLARLPYVGGERETGPEQAAYPSRATPTSFFSDPIRRGLALGLAAVLLLGVIWFIAGRGKKSEIASNGKEKPWETAVPRPDAPEAPAWSPPSVSLPAEGVQSTQAQPFGLAGDSQPVTRSPLGFELPPGNSWGSPQENPANTPAAQPPLTTGQPILTWENPQATQASPAPATMQAQMNAQYGVPPMNPSGNPSTPWANAAGFAANSPAATPMNPVSQGYASVAPAGPAAVSSAGSAQIVRNPYFNNEPVAQSVNVPSNQSAGDFTPGDTTRGQPVTATLPASWPTPVELQPPSAVNGPSAVIASRPNAPPFAQPTTPPSVQTPGSAAGYPQAGQWNVPSADSAAYSSGPSVSGSVPQNTWGNSAGQLPSPGSPIPSTGGNPSNVGLYSNGLPSSQPAYQGPVGVQTQPQSPYKGPSAAVWGDSRTAVPAQPPQNGQNQQAPVYPSTDSYRYYGPTSQPGTQQPHDNQVVPAAYANPSWGCHLNSSTPSPMGPTAPTGRSQQQQAGTSADQLYPTTGQTGYNLYPTSVLR